MNDFISIDFLSDKSQENLIEVLMLNFPEFNWRGGDNDMQGLYISGMNKESVQIQLWLEEPSVMTISFRSAWISEENRGKKKELLFTKIQNVISSVFTKILRIKDVE